jgi:hypothetical protein
MSVLREKTVKKIETLPEDVLKSVLDFIEYVGNKEEEVKEFELKYGPFRKLKEKIMQDEHTWEEEKDFFEWEAVITEMDKLKKISEIRSGDQ